MMHNPRGLPHAQDNPYKYPSYPSQFPDAQKPYRYPGIPEEYRDSASPHSSLNSPRPRYRSPEEYHYDYRGGYRPSDLDSRDGYTTDGSGSGIREGSLRGFENFRYPDREALLGSNRTSPFGSHHAVKGDGVEREPFLGSVEPVRLTPSWEQRNLSKEELNFKNVKPFEPFETEAEPPKDKLNLVFLTFVLHGIGTLMPWNMFINAKDYFVEFKFGKAVGDTAAYRTNFLPYIGFAAQIPNVLCNWTNIFVQFGGSYTTKIVGSIFVEVLMFIATVVLAMVDSSQWPGNFFILTIVSVVILNIANGIYQNTIYGLAARLPFEFTGAVILGSNISGTFTAVINIISIAMAPNIRTSAIYYFITALFVLLACFDTYFALPLNKFYRYHDHKHEKVAKESKRTPGKVRTPFWRIFVQTSPQLFNVFMVFFVTLAVFPSVIADTCRTDENFFIPTKYFTAVVCFLTFNVFAMLGNMLPGLLMWPGPRFLCIPVVLRVLFIPAFLMCHYYPVDVERVMPVFIDSDYVFWVLVIFMGLTSGYYSSLAMMYCPKMVAPEHAAVAGMMGAASLVTGIFAGVNFQFAAVEIVTKIPDAAGFGLGHRNCTLI